jgi:hypothetical protein
MEDILGKRKSINPPSSILADCLPTSPLSMPTSPNSISSPGSDHEDEDDTQSTSSSSSARSSKRRKVCAPQWVEELKCKTMS